MDSTVKQRASAAKINIFVAIAVALHLHGFQCSDCRRLRLPGLPRRVLFSPQLRGECFRPQIDSPSFGGLRLDALLFLLLFELFEGPLFEAATALISDGVVRQLGAKLSVLLLLDGSHIHSAETAAAFGHQSITEFVDGFPPFHVAESAVSQQYSS